MIVVKKAGENRYYVSLAGNSKVLNWNSCYLLKKELVKLMKSKREITLDLIGVQNIDFAGLEILFELRDLMDAKNCEFDFINVDPSIAKKVFAVENKRKQSERNILDVDF